jgi:hypothetical protein
MPNFRLPLSGDVTQTINPWNWFFKPVDSQFGLININLGKSSDPALEQQILSDVGSYGRQIGQIGDAVRVLIKHGNLQNLDIEDRRAINALLFQLDEIDRLKAKRAGAAPAAQQAT